MGKTRIEWADKTWNVVTGCSKVSEGCRNCYAERMSKRLAGRCGYPADEPFKVTFHNNLRVPLRWKKPWRIFANSMSDWFHPDVPDEKRDELFGVIIACHILTNVPDHIFMLLTKRPAQMLKYFTDRSPVELLRAWAKAANWITIDDPDVLFEDLVYSASCFDWDAHGRNSSGSEHKPWGYINKLWPLPNLWLGVTAENQATADERIPILFQTPRQLGFVSIEPMLGPIDLSRYVGQESLPVDLGGVTLQKLRPELDWVICGGETGPGARPMHPDWVRSLRDQCQVADVPFFFKSFGEYVRVGKCMDEEDDGEFYSKSSAAGTNVQRLNLQGGMGYHGEKSIYMQRIGKKKAGRELDGRTWEEFPGNGGEAHD